MPQIHAKLRNSLSGLARKRSCHDTGQYKKGQEHSHSQPDRPPSVIRSSEPLVDFELREPLFFFCDILFLRWRGDFVSSRRRAQVGWGYGAFELSRRGELKIARDFFNDLRRDLSF